MAENPMNTQSQLPIVENSCNNQIDNAQADSNIQKLPIHLVKTPNVNWNVMRFNAKDFVELSQWGNAKMWRDKLEEIDPKKEQTDEVQSESKSRFKRKKMRKANPNSQAEIKPWILNINGKTGKKFKGIRAGGIGQHSSYYVFKSSPSGSIEAHPLEEFYNFQTISRFTPLTAEEAEEQYGRRKQVLNYFSIMTRKRLMGDEKQGSEPEDGDGKKANANKASDLKISDMDEWMSSSDCESDDVDEPEKKKKKKSDQASDDDEPAGKKKGKGKAIAKNKKKKNEKKGNDKQEAFEESDDGDDDGRELDYDSASSDGEPDLETKFNMKSVAEEDGLRKLLKSDDDDDTDDEEKKLNDDKLENLEENEENKNSDQEQKKKEEKIKKSNEKGEASSKKKMSKKLEKSKKRRKEAIEDQNKSIQLALEQKVTVPTDDIITASQITSKTLESDLPSCSTGDITPKRIPIASNINDDIQRLEEATRRYLLRKPMTTVEILHKIKAKNTDLANDALIEKMTAVLKKIKPTKSTVRGKMYLSLKEEE